MKGKKIDETEQKSGKIFGRAGARPAGSKVARVKVRLICKR